MMDGVRRSIAIDTFARTVIDLYGFTGADAAREEQNLRETLTARGTVDYDELRERGEKHLRARLRARLKEEGLTVSEIDELLESQPGRMPEPMLGDDPAVPGLSERIGAYTRPAVGRGLPWPERRSGGERRSGVDRRRKALARQVAASMEQRSGVERRSAADRRRPLDPRPPE